MTANEAPEIRIIEADTMRGNVLIHFSNGVSVLYPAQSLYDIRDQEGNMAFSNDVEEDAS